MGKLNLETNSYQVLLGRFWHENQEPPVEIMFILAKENEINYNKQ